MADPSDMSLTIEDYGDESPLGDVFEQDALLPPSEQSSTAAHQTGSVHLMSNYEVAAFLRGNADRSRFDSDECQWLTKVICNYLDTLPSAHQSDENMVQYATMMQNAGMDPEYIINYLNILPANDTDRYLVEQKFYSSELSIGLDELRASTTTD
eukprot:CAMPEP_0177654192 /NCGR_PEP_ID=MMETSP0447-20121125/14174_1 /TAXON_ID=0 /ORGANISM="Stygamoeba regulata, Strain BSH-02190019" /LENGTH=153 /DNA_ID=CAMNT_0019157771 /DNA_START=56 /DNA_END=517 /DNA_ORIENTATION=+